MSPQAERDAPSWATIKWLAPVVVALAGTVGGYQVLGYRVDSLERDLHIRKAQRDADHAFLVKVAEDLRLFMCSQDKAYCKN